MLTYEFTIAVSIKDWHKWTGIASCSWPPPSPPPSPAFPSVIFLTPPKDDMEIHVSASLTMRSYKAIKRKIKREEDWDLRVFVTVMSIDWWQRKRLRGPRQRGRGRQTERISFVESNIQRQDVHGHFSLPFLLLYYINQRASGTFIWTECHRDVRQAKRKKKKKTTRKSILQRCLFPDSGINCLVLNDHGHCITWKLTARIYEFMWVPLSSLPAAAESQKQIIELVQVHKAFQRLM